MADLPAWLQQTLDVLKWAAPLALWMAVCLWAINWNKLGPALREGAWVPFVLLIILVALVWSQTWRSQLDLFGLIALGNFWWQLALVGLLAGLALFCGWVQQRYSWTPMEVAVEPPAHGHHDDHHGHHGHDQHHDHPAPAGHHGHH